MITEKHENSVYVKRGDSILEYSQKTYDEIMTAGAKTFENTRDIVSLFVPRNASITCRSGDVSNSYQTPTDVRDVMFMITQGEGSQY